MTGVGAGNEPPSEETETTPPNGRIADQMEDDDTGSPDATVPRPIKISKTSQPNMQGPARAGDNPHSDTTDAQGPSDVAAHTRALQILAELNTRPRYVSDHAALQATRIVPHPPTVGDTTTDGIFPIDGHQEEHGPLSPPVAGLIRFDHKLIGLNAPTGNAHAASSKEGGWNHATSEPPRAPPLESLAPGFDLCGAAGIPCHVVRTPHAPTGPVGKPKGKARPYPTIFDEAVLI